MLSICSCTESVRKLEVGCGGPIRTEYTIVELSATCNWQP